MATTPSFCGEFTLKKSCAGRANNTWRSWAWAEREQGWWAEAVCAPGWGSGRGRRRRMPPSAPGNAGGEGASACLALPWLGGQRLLCACQDESPGVELAPAPPALGWGGVTAEDERQGCHWALGNRWCGGGSRSISTRTSAQAEFPEETSVPVP